MRGTFGALPLAEKNWSEKEKRWTQGKWPDFLRLCNSQGRVYVELDQTCVQNPRKTNFRDPSRKSRSVKGMGGRGWEAH